MNEAAADESLVAILLTSSQPVFCAGADLKEAARVDMIEQARRIIAVLRAIVVAPVPVVVRLDGPAHLLFGARHDLGGLAGGLVTRVAAPGAMDEVVAEVLTDLRKGHRQGLTSAKALLTPDLLADFDARGEEMARLSGLLFHSAAAQELMAAALRR